VNKTILNFITAFVLATLTNSAQSQWLGMPTPGIPRLADGSADMNAPTPTTADGKPDFTGLWRVTRNSGQLRNEENIQAWAKESRATHERNYYKDGPQMQCMPGGPAYIVGGPGGGGTLRQIVQSPQVLAMLYGDLTWRQIFTDGRTLENDPVLTWNGYSVGHWEGNTLVVESNGFNNKTWLHADGLEHSEQLTITERYTRNDFGHMTVEVTYDDPLTLKQPLTISVGMDYAADDVILEIVCDESTEGGTKHWVGDKLADARASSIKLSKELLSNYVGTFEGIWLEYPTKVEVTLRDNALFLSRNGSTSQELIPQSETTFICATCQWSQPYIFNTGQDGKAESVLEVQVSGRWLFDKIK
jgi:hypothetical protein